jgi:hypothetical protein
MFVMTETAGMRLAKKLDEQRANDDVAMRFVRKPRGWKLCPEKPASGDVRFAHGDRTVLVLDAEAAKLLGDRTLDAKESPTGSKLYLR